MRETGMKLKQISPSEPLLRHSSFRSVQLTYFTGNYARLTCQTPLGSLLILLENEQYCHFPGDEFLSSNSCTKTPSALPCGNDTARRRIIKCAREEKTTDGINKNLAGSKD